MNIFKHIYDGFVTAMQAIALAVAALFVKLSPRTNKGAYAIVPVLLAPILVGEILRGRPLYKDDDGSWDDGSYKP